MATTSPSAAIVPVAPVFSAAERLALAGSLAPYSGLTRQVYELDLRQYASWCQTRRLALFGARRADIECFARDLEARGRARATISRRLCTIAGFYRYAVEEELLDHSPAAHVRRPLLGWLGGFSTPARWAYEDRAAASGRPAASEPLIIAGHIAAPGGQPGGPAGRAKAFLDALHDDRRSGPKYCDLGAPALLADDDPWHVCGLALEVRPGVPETRYLIGAPPARRRPAARGSAGPL